MISRERFQFPHAINEIVKISIVNLQVKKTQDRPVEGIYNLSTVIYMGIMPGVGWRNRLAKIPFHVKDFLFTII